MPKIPLELTPAADIRRVGESGRLSAYAADGDQPRLEVRPFPADLPFGLYRLEIETPDAAAVLDSSVILAEPRDGGRPVAVRATFERRPERLDAYFVLPADCRGVSFSPVFVSDGLRFGAAALERVSTTRRRLERLRGALRQWARSPASLGRDVASFGAAVREDGLVGLRREMAEALNPTRILDVDDVTMRMPRFSATVAARNREALAAAGSGGAPRSASLSIVVPVYRTPQAWLRQLIESLDAQSDQGFELVLVFDGPQEALRAFAAGCIRGAYRRTAETLPENRGVSAATNVGIRAATGDYVVVVDHDDVLERHFVEAFRYAAAAKPADIYFADEAITDGEMTRVNTVATRGKFDIRHYLSHPYIVHPIFVRRELAHRAGLFDESLKVSHDVDFFLRCVAKAGNIVQIPLLLYYWRTHESSLGHVGADMVAANTRAAIRRYLEARTDWSSFEIRDGINFNEYDVRPPVPRDARAAIVIPTRNRRQILAACLASIAAGQDANCVPADIFVVDHESDDPKTVAFLAREAAAGRITVIPHHGPWNYAAINNAAVAEILTRGAYTHLVFMNNDIEIVTDDWLDRMMAQFSWGDVGVVGCCLQYPDGRVQHGGVVVGLVGPAEHSHKFEPLANRRTGRRYPGHLSSLVATRDYSAVTAALMIVPTHLFQAIGGFDERLAVGFNDTDLCLRIGARGLRSTYVGSVLAIHHESVSRGDDVQHPEDTRLFCERYGDIIRDGDDHYGLWMDWSSAPARISLKPQKSFRLPETRLGDAGAGRPALDVDAPLSAGASPAGRS